MRYSTLNAEMRSEYNRIMFDFHPRLPYIHVLVLLLLLSVPKRSPFLATFPLPCSLVSRPFPPQAFDRLQYAKTGGEGLGERVTCMTSGTCRHEGAVPDRCNSNFLFDQPQIYQIMSCIDTVFRTLQSQVFGQGTV